MILCKKKLLLIFDIIKHIDQCNFQRPPLALETICISALFHPISMQRYYPSRLNQIIKPVREVDIAAFVGAEEMG